MACSTGHRATSCDSSSKPLSGRLLRRQPHVQQRHRVRPWGLRAPAVAVPGCGRAPPARASQPCSESATQPESTGSSSTQSTGAAARRLRGRRCRGRLSHGRPKAATVGPMATANPTNNSTNPSLPHVQQQPFAGGICRHRWYWHSPPAAAERPPPAASGGAVCARKARCRLARVYAESFKVLGMGVQWLSPVTGMGRWPPGRKTRLLQRSVKCPQVANLPPPRQTLFQAGSRE